ncbi:MAG: hypothetical protein D3922_03560 [Candidatus Electrothrix sp. AR1]|nr:hypothetical protein [Candidatus Electrothrix sp. AR1]
MRKEVQSRIVRFALPTLSKDKKTNRYFSGYILGNGIIITCRHGFATADGKYDHQRPLLVRIASQDSKDSDYEVPFQETTLQGLVNEGIILFESKNYDIVLLQCEPVTGIFESLLTNELEQPGDWEAGGYPYYNRDNRATAGLELFSGSFETVVSEGKHLQLNVTTELPRMEDWREASGSPIFIQGKLAGILCRYFEYDSKRKKQVIPKRLTAVYLKNDKETLAEAVLNLNKHQLMEMCSDLHKKEKLSGIKELLLYAMAFHYENASCFEQEPTEDKPYIDVPVVRVEACEFLMASKDRRDPSFRKTTNSFGKTEVVPVKFSLISPPEYGFHPNAADDILQQFMAGRADIQAVKERIFGDFPRSDHVHYNQKKRRAMALAMLKKEEGTYYWLLDVSGGNISQLQDVRGLPIAVLNVPSDPEGEFELAEEDIFSDLALFIED